MVNVLGLTCAVLLVVTVEAAPQFGGSFSQASAQAGTYNQFGGNPNLRPPRQFNQVGGPRPTKPIFRPPAVIIPMGPIPLGPQRQGSSSQSISISKSISISNGGTASSSAVASASG